MISRIDHIVVAVQDLDAACRCYTDLLGRAPSWRGRHPLLGTENVLFALANTYLELLSPGVPEEADAEGAGQFGKILQRHLDERGEGVFAIALGTEDADRVVAALAESGIEAGPPVPGEGRDETTGLVRRWRNVILPTDATRGVRIFVIEHDPDSPDLALAEPVTTHGSVSSGSTDGCVAALDHIVLQTRAPDEAIALFRDTLGMRLALDRSFAARGVRLLFFRAGGATLEVAASIEPALGEGEGDGEGESASASANEPDRLWGLAWQVEDVGQMHSRLEATGAAATSLRTGNKPGTTVFTIKSETHGVPTLVIGPE